MNQNFSKLNSATKHPKDMRRRWYLKCFLLLALGSNTVVCAQKKTKISISAKQLEGDIINGESCKKLTGEVIFILDKFTIQANHAIYYEKKRLIEAQGQVKIIHEDGAVVTANQLVYEEGSRLAKLRGHVVYKTDTTVFYTDHFDYNTESKEGHFAQGGKLIEGNNVLTSEFGQYNDLDKSATFYQNVVLVNPEYTIKCDTLYYNTITKIARFEGFTRITSQDGQRALTTYEGGEYNASNQESTFARSKVETESYTLYGDLLRTDQAAAIYTATGHVKLITKEGDMIISGDYGQYQKEKGVTQIYGNALMTKVLDEEEVYLSADAFVATENKAEQDGANNTTVRAYHNVKLYKEDLQGKADSMTYRSADSTIYFHGDPIFWTDAGQLTADSVYILLRDKVFHEMHMYTRAFVASEDAAGNYNQLRGNNMVTFFKENKIDSIEIEGNAESIYFVLEREKVLRGMNYLRCSHIRIKMIEGTMANITFRHKPIGTFYPPQEIKEKFKKFGNFKWRIAERPTKQEVVAHGYGTREAYKEFKLNSER